MSSFLGACPACGADSPKTWYSRVDNRLTRVCDGCGHTWKTDTLDKHPAVIALKELGHAV